MKIHALIAAAVAATAGVANAQFVVTGPATVDSFAAQGNANNGTFSAVYGGPNTLFSSVSFVGTLTNPEATGTFSSEARWRITNGLGGGANFQFQGGTTFTDPIAVNATRGSLVWANTGDTFGFEAFESFTDSATVTDARWENPEFTFDNTPTIVNLGLVGPDFSVDTATTPSGFDTMLALYTATGTLLAVNDDFAGLGLLSRIENSGLADGEYYIVLGRFNSSFGDGIATGLSTSTATSDFVLNIDDQIAFQGQHTGSELLVFSVTVPAPGSLALLGLGGLVAARRRRA
jgi:hypothetical protein